MAVDALSPLEPNSPGSQNMRLLLAIAAACLTCSAPSSFAAEPTARAKAEQAMTKVDTRTFVSSVIANNEFEIRTGQLALVKAQDADIETFAKKMIVDHNRMADDLKSALDSVDMTAATNPTLDGSGGATLDALDTASDTEFEAKYIAAQAEAHRDAVVLFRSYAESGDDPALKEFAKRTLPLIEMHEKQVKELQAARNP